MKNVFVIVRALAVAFALLVAITATLKAAPVRVAAFNVMNYLSMDRHLEGRFRPNYPKPENEKEAVRSIIRDVAPDILLLEEMGPAPYLEELRQDLAREGRTYEHSYVLEAADSERHVAVLSRVPMVRVTPHAEIAFTYFGEKELVKRGLLELAFDSPGGTWTIFATHLKSRLTDRPDDPESAKRRALEAQEIRDLVLKRFPDPATARFAIAGDFNDVTNSRPLAALRRRGKTLIARVVPTADSRGETWTYRYLAADAFSRVDFILVSPGLWPCVVGGRGYVHDGAGALVGSDHRMVYLDLDLDAVKPASTANASPEPSSDNENEDQPISERSP